MAIILGAQSNVWTQLTLPNPPSGSVPFVFTDNVTISCDVTNFSYDLTNFRLLIANGLKIAYTDTSAVPGAATINKSAGRVKIAAGQTVLVVTNSLVAAGDIVDVNIETLDATFNRVISIASAGMITITGNAAATAAVTMSFILNKVY